MLTEIETPIIKLSIQEHPSASSGQAEERLFADFPNIKELNDLIREVPGRRWSNTKKQWHFNLNKQVLELLKQKFVDKAVLDTSLLNKQWAELELKSKEEKFADVEAETVKA